MNKKERQLEILKLIAESEIDTQEELTEQLNGKGIQVTQATVSRDINELNLIKVAGKVKKNKYAQVDVKNLSLSDKILSLFSTIPNIATQIIEIKYIEDAIKAFPLKKTYEK